MAGVLAIALCIWSLLPVIGPLLGVQRSPEELIDWVNDHNLVVLVDPSPIVTDGKGSYGDWAIAELGVRRKIAVLLWILSIVPLALWVARGKTEDNSDSSRQDGFASTAS